MRRVPVNVVVCQLMMYSNVIVGITIFRCLFMFSKSCVKVPASLTTVGSLCHLLFAPSDISFVLSDISVAQSDLSFAPSDLSFAPSYISSAPSDLLFASSDLSLAPSDIIVFTLSFLPGELSLQLSNIQDRSNVS